MFFYQKKKAEVGKEIMTFATSTVFSFFDAGDLTVNDFPWLLAYEYIYIYIYICIYE